MSDQTSIHGTAIAVGRHGVLIRGRSGSGKSDLALRCLAVPIGPFAAEQPLLVADDRVVAQAGPASVVMTAPPPLRGLLEVRGIGILPMPSVESADLVLVADITEAERIDRLPDDLAPARICEHDIPRMLIAPFEAAAPLKLLLTLALRAAVRNQK